MGFGSAESSAGAVREADTPPDGIRRRSEHLISQTCEENFPLMGAILTHSYGGQSTRA